MVMCYIWAGLLICSILSAIILGNGSELAAAVPAGAQAGITLDKRTIVISDPIKSVGTYTVQCKLGYEITAPLTVKIEEA